MSFFGLTHLGPQNSFKSFLNDKSYLHIFEVKDIENAFQKVSTNGMITMDDIPSLLKALYRGPFPSSDHDLFCDELKEYKNKSIKWNDVKNRFMILKEKQILQVQDDNILNDNNTTNNYNKSYKEYREATNRHIRKEDGPMETLNKPLTSNQEFGWNRLLFLDDNDDSNEDDKMKLKRMESTKYHPKMSCAETKYTSELVKSGVFY